jgi:poly(A) polymerase
LTRRVSRDPLLKLLRDCAVTTNASLYLVGGPVRDAALGRPAADADLTVVRSRDEFLAALRERLGTRGFRFRKRGVTTWRFACDLGEVDVVDAVRRGLDGDLLRRELTINAMAYSMTERRVADPQRGLSDLRARRLRAPGERVFREDPVRCLRVARFLATLDGFRLERRTLAWLVAESSRLRRASVERVREETTKLLATRAPHVGLDAAKRWGVLDAMLPELVPLAGCAAGRDRPDVWRHTLDTIEASATRTRLPSHREVRDRGELALLRWSLLFHDIAKPATLVRDANGKPTFHGHEVLGAAMAEGVLKRLRFDATSRRRIRQLVLWHLRPGHLADAGAPARGMRRLAREAGDDLPLLCLHAGCDARGSGGPEDRARWRRMRHVLRRLPEVRARLAAIPADPLLSGADVMRVTGLPPGPRIGRLLREIAEARDDGAFSTRREALAWLRGR